MKRLLLSSQALSRHVSCGRYGSFTFASNYFLLGDVLPGARKHIPDGFPGSPVAEIRKGSGSPSYPIQK